MAFPPGSANATMAVTIEVQKLVMWDYLRTVVDKVVVNGSTATISGSHAKLMRAVAAKKVLAGQVPTFIQDWRARRDSNSRPLGSKPSTLSS
jgi:hypothetical protein